MSMELRHGEVTYWKHGGCAAHVGPREMLGHRRDAALKARRYEDAIRDQRSVKASQPLEQKKGALNFQGAL
jgi:hypothetical protein